MWLFFPPLSSYAAAKTHQLLHLTTFSVRRKRLLSCQGISLTESYFTAWYWRIRAFLFAQNKTTHRLWMLQSKQGNMPWNLFRSEEKKQLSCWSRRGRFNSHWNCWIFHSQHSFLQNRSTNEEQLKSKPSDRWQRRHTMKSCFLHKTPECFQTAASAREQRQACPLQNSSYCIQWALWWS